MYFSYWPQFLLYLIEIADVTGLVWSTRGQLEVRNMRCRTEVWWSVRIFKLSGIVWKTRLDTARVSIGRFQKLFLKISFVSKFCKIVKF